MARTAAAAQAMDISWSELSSLLKRAEGLSLSGYARDKGWNAQSFAKAVKAHYGESLVSRRGRNGGAFLVKPAKAGKATKIETGSEAAV